jgi:hypothetical protein
MFKAENFESIHNHNGKAKKFSGVAFHEFEIATEKPACPAVLSTRKFLKILVAHFLRFDTFPRS